MCTRMRSPSLLFILYCKNLLLIKYFICTNMQTPGSVLASSEFMKNNQSIKTKKTIIYCLDMNTADPFADTDPEDMAVDAVQKQLDGTRPG